MFPNLLYEKIYVIDMHFSVGNLLFTCKPGGLNNLTNRCTFLSEWSGSILKCVLCVFEQWKTNWFYFSWGRVWGLLLLGRKKWRCLNKIIHCVYHGKFCLLYSESGGLNNLFDLLKHVPRFLPFLQSSIPSTHLPIYLDF